MAYNTFDSPNLAKYSPYELVFSRKPKILLDLETDPDIKVSGTFKDCHTLLNKRLKYLQNILQQFKSKWLATINKDCKDFQYHSGDLVYNISPLTSQLRATSRKVTIKYVGTLSHLFDRFYVVTKFEIPKVKDLEFTTIPYDAGYKHFDAIKTKGRYPLGLINEIKEYCIKIAPHIAYYKKQIEYYNCTAYEILTNELALILPTFSKQERQKERYYYISLTGFISLAYEGISSFLHYKRQKALHKVVKAMENKVDLQCNDIFHLEDSVVMYGIYNSDNLEALIDTVHRLHNQSTWNEKLFAGQIDNWYH